MSSTLSAAPVDIKSRNLHSHDASCAFPSWPRRSSLDGEDQGRPTSFLSDDDLFLGDPFDDDVSSIPSSSAASSPSPSQREPQLTGEQLLQMEMERAALQRQYVQQIIGEKERRRQAKKAAAQRKHASTSKKSPKTKLANMTPIAE
jgi:hypothetical protein